MLWLITGYRFCFKRHFVGIVTFIPFGIEGSYYKIIRFRSIQIINGTCGINGFPIWMGVLVGLSFLTAKNIVACQIGRILWGPLERNIHCIAGCGKTKKE
jgi:hypothetical protein